MIAPGNSVITLVLTLGILITSAYALGRIHQWHRYGVERDEAYRKGFDKASGSLVAMMGSDRDDPAGSQHRRNARHARTRSATGSRTGSARGTGMAALPRPTRPPHRLR